MKNRERVVQLNDENKEICSVEIKEYLIDEYENPYKLFKSEKATSMLCEIFEEFGELKEGVAGALFARYGIDTLLFSKTIVFTDLKFYHRDMRSVLNMFKKVVFSKTAPGEEVALVAICTTELQEEVYSSMGFSKVYLLGADAILIHNSAISLKYEVGVL